MMKPFSYAAGLCALFLVGGAAAVGAPPPSFSRGPAGLPPLIALTGVERGLWELRERGVHGRDGASVTRLCVRHPSQLMNIRHRDAQCRYYVIMDEPSRAVLTYQCAGSGTGRTDLRVETSRLVQIEAQGVDKGAPFVMLLEGRRTGDCR